MTDDNNKSPTGRSNNSQPDFQDLPPAKPEPGKPVKNLIVLYVSVILETEDELVDVSEETGFGDSAEPVYENMRSYKVLTVMAGQSPNGRISAGKMIRIPQDGDSLPYPVFRILHDEKNGFSLTLEAGSY